MKTELIRQRCAASGLLLALVLAACSPESPSSLVAKGQADLANKDPRAAVVSFKAALQVEPGATATRWEASWDDPRAGGPRRLSRCRAGCGDYFA